jgi:WD40 repeat protein
MRFVLANIATIDSTPLQIYSSLLAFSPMESKVRAGFQDVIPRWMSIMTELEIKWGSCLQTLEGHSDWVQAIAFSHDSALLASASVDCTIWVWDPHTGTCMQTLRGHSRSVGAVVFSHDSTLLASASDDHTIRVWDPCTGICMETPKGHSGSVLAIAFSHDSALLASASDDRMIRIWDPHTGTCIQTLKGYSGSVGAVVFLHDSTLLASASDDRMIRVWNPRTGICMRTLKGHSGWVRVIAFSHDSALLASASSDCTIRVWDPRTGTCRQTLYTGVTYSSLSFRPGNLELLTNVGAFAIRSRKPISLTSIPVPETPSHRYSSGISSDRCWVTWKGENLLWLPKEYRPSCSSICGSMVVIGCYSGKVLFINLSSDKLPELLSPF